jgi:endonuclease/exonuclease/phosphatase family metal-dependent hydrolase
MSWAALRSCVGKGKSLIATWVRLKSKSRQNSLVLVSAYVRPISPTRSQAEFADDLSALTVDIEHWQQKNTVVVCGDFNARIGRQVQSPTNSVVLSSRSRGTLKELR